MADHLVTGLLEVQVTCGNLSCGKKWRQPGLDPMERVGWIVCPHCNWSAPTNVARDLNTGPDDDGTDHLEHRALRLQGKLSTIAETIGLPLGGGEDGYLIPAIEQLVAERNAMQAAITRTLSAWEETGYVGGIDTREAWRIMGEQIGPYRIEQAGQPA